MKVIKGLLFDLDGTLADTLEANFKAYEKAVAVTGRKLERHMYESTYGDRVDVFLRKFFNDISDGEIEVIKREKSVAYKTLLHLVRPNIQLIDFIKTLKSHHTTALVTMARRENAEGVLEVLDIVSLFDHVLTGDEVSHPKPHPEIYIKALETCGLAADETLAFEDSDRGIEAAQAAGIQTLSIKISPAEKA